MHTDPLCFTAQIYNYRLKGRLLTFLGEGGMAFPPTYALASAATVFEVVTKGGGRWVCESRLHGSKIRNPERLFTACLEKFDDLDQSLFRRVLNDE